MAGKVILTAEQIFGHHDISIYLRPTQYLPLADVHLYKQFGNSVTVNVIEASAKQIKEVLDNVGI